MDVSKGILYLSQNRFDWTTGNDSVQSVCILARLRKEKLKDRASALSAVERQLEQSMDSERALLTAAAAPSLSGSAQMNTFC